MKSPTPSRAGKTAERASAPATAPPRPAAAADAADPGAAGSPRRTFVRRAWWLIGGAAAGEFLWVLGSFLRPRRSAGATPGLFVAGPLDRFEKASVTAFPEGRFYLVRLETGEFMALHRECTHLGCTVPWDATGKRFACPCHASVFDITGAVLGPPAPRPLDYYPVRIENGLVKVDTRQRTRREAFDMAQATSA